MTSRSRSPLAVLSALLLVAAPLPAMPSDPAGDATCNAPGVASESKRASMRTSDKPEGAPGYWISEAAMQRAAKRIDACIEMNTKCGVDLSAANAKASAPGWKTWTIAVGAALATGFIAGRLAWR